MIPIHNPSISQYFPVFPSIKITISKSPPSGINTRISRDEHEQKKIHISGSEAGSTSCKL